MKEVQEKLNQYKQLLPYGKHDRDVPEMDDLIKHHKFCWVQEYGEGNAWRL